MKYRWHILQPWDTDRVKSQARSGREKRKTNVLIFVQNKSSLPCFVCLQSFRFSYRSEWKVGQGAGSVWIGCCGVGQQSERDRPGVSTALNRTAAEQEHNIRRRTSMQLGETHIPVCHDKQRGCVSMLFFYNYCKMCSFSLGSKTASTNSKQRGCPQKTFSATPSMVEPKVTEKQKGTKSQEKSIYTTSNKIQKTNISPIYT